MTRPFDSVDDLARKFPEWTPWLSVVGAALDSIGSSAWETVRVEGSRERCGEPLLAGARLELDATAACTALDKVMRAAAAMNGLTATPTAFGEAETLALVSATLRRDCETLALHATNRQVEPSIFEAACCLAAKPILHACRRRHAQEAARGWAHSYCPVCGGWPAFAEVRGVERERYLRCADCGSDWQTHGLRCAYCGNADHEQLATLVPEAEHPDARIEVCHVCKGYLKVFTVLRATPPENIVLRDLASAELDIAAVSHGYRRPQSAAYTLDVQVSGT